jgi:hypothetical protein
VSPADELSAVNPDSKKEAVLATNEVLSQSDVASDELAPLAGGKIGQGSSGTRNAILYDLYDDGTCIAVGFDYPTQASGSAWTAMFPEDGQITLTDELSSGNGGTYTLVAIADNFNFDETKGVHVPCTRIRISETVVSIGDNAFRDAKAEVLTFPATGALEEIGEYAFYSCSIANGTGALNYQLVLTSGLKTVGDYAFSGDTRGGISATGFSGTPVEVWLPSSIENIGDYAFDKCGSQFDLNFGSNLGYIGDNAFAYAKINPSNSNLVFPDGLTYIGDRTFVEMGGVTGTVIIPDSVTTIGDEAFFRLFGADGFQRQKLAEVDVTFPDLPGEDVFLDNDFSGVETSNNGELALGKSARWTNSTLSEAQITIEYGEQLQTSPELDVVFVLDYSGSMTWSAGVEKDGVSYEYPRIFLMEDIMNDAIDELLGANSQGYDVRLGMVGFSADAGQGAESTNWNSGGFSTSASDLKANFTQNPHASGGTRYATGIEQAINMIDARTDAEKAEREAVIIFLSDGVPNAGYEGLGAAQTLRDKGITLFPMGLYINDLDKVDSSESSSPEEAEAALKAISHDGQSAYVANSTEAFETIMGDLILRSVTQMGTTVEDVISEYFAAADIAGNVTNISASAGSYKLDGDKVTWNLAGEKKGIVHELTIDVALKADYLSQESYDAILPTNNSLKTIDEENAPILEASNQPELYRGVVEYVFVSATPGIELPSEIKNYLPAATNGYAKSTLVNAAAPTATEYVDALNQGTWTFVEWDKDTVTVGSGDVTFTGSWVFVSGLAGYTVNHYKETLEGDYELADTETLSAAKNASVTAQAKDYEYFMFNEAHPNHVVTGTVDENGGLVLNLYYDLCTYQIVYRCNQYTGGELPVDPTVYKIGQTLTVSDCNTMVKEGHDFSHWQTQDAGFTYKPGDTLSHATSSNPLAGPALEDYSGTAPHYTVYAYAAWTPQAGEESPASPDTKAQAKAATGLLKAGDSISAMVFAVFGILALAVLLITLIVRRKAKE